MFATERGRHPDAPERNSAALTRAVRAAGRFDRTMVSFRSGGLAAIPVVIVVGTAIALGHPVPAVTMGAGAMLVGVAWRTTGGRPPLALMATDAAVMAVSTFVGCVTGSVTWVHILVLCVWSLMAGLLVSLGNRGGAVGTQAIIAVVVFGRFSEPAPAALGLAALVLAGGLTQVAFLSLVRWPLPLRGQRAATATAYRALSRLAAADDDASTLPAADALDVAGSGLAAPTMFGDAAVMTLRTLVSEGYRLRIELMAIHTLLRQHHELRAATESWADARARRALDLAASALALAAGAIEGHRDDAALLQQRLSALNADTGELAAAAAGRPGSSSLGSPALLMSPRLSALTGQLRAVGSLAPAAGRGGGLRSRRPYRPTSRPVSRLRSDAQQIRANMSLQSPAGRHALRLAVVVPVAELISRQLPVQRGYWVAVAAATVLRPEFGATFTRGTERALGTCLGVGLAGAITVALHPAGGVTVAMIGLLAWVGYSVFPASFAVGYGFITALVVFLLDIITPDTFSIASARLIDTLIGGTIGLLAYALWPTWSHDQAWQSLADLVGAGHAYLVHVLRAFVNGQRAPEHELQPLARRARLARTAAEATVAQSLSEPSTRRIDADRSQEALGAMRRLVRAANVLQLDAQEDRPRRPLPGLGPLSSDVDSLLGTVEATIRTGPPESGTTPARPDLRAAYLAFEREASGERDAMALTPELDEIVDASNGLAALSGLERMSS
ncbi:MAG: FUSC family protein [Solirubrobacteraceae bacterium]